MQGGINKISQLKMAPWENIFEHVSIDNFRRMGNKILNTLRVALLNPVALIEKQVGIEAILCKFYDDPIQGGQKTLFLKRYDSRYY